MELLHLNFKEEAIELIEGIEKSLLAMENNFNDAVLIEEVFRNMHTLKGNSAMFGFKVITDFTHRLESVYELIRSGDIKISKQISNVTFSALDHLAALVKNGAILNEAESKTHKNLSEKIVEIIKNAAGKKQQIDPYEKLHENEADANNGLTAWHIRFYPNKSFFENGNNPLHVIDELRCLGEYKVIANVDNIPLLEDYNADACYTSWNLHLTCNEPLERITEVFQFVEHKCKFDINEVLPDKVLSTEKVFETSNLSSLKEINKALIRDKENPPVLNKKHIISSIRVPSERLDNLMNLVSELMTLQAKLATLTEQNPQTELLGVSENLEKISTRLRDNAFSMCLVPLENMITPFHRLVRDLAADLNKEIDFVTEGTETELDKNIMEGLSDPLMHLIRNSIDHGIEDPETRLKLGKHKHGKILFKAYCAGTNVYIEIQDDGKGIDPEKIRKKAIEKGIIGADDNLNDKEILNLIFLPGFSTAEQVSEISGRGVGMDVVKKKITDIRGQIKINSQVKVGTTITIKLPITVSIIDGLLVKINGEDFVMPLSAMDRCYEMPEGKPLNRFNNLIVLDGQQIPFISLAEEFDGTENPGLSKEIVIVYYEEKKVGLIVDRVVGKFQAVLKPLGKYFLQMDNISGATILGNGKIALVLDTNNVIEQFLNKKRG